MARQKLPEDQKKVLYNCYLPRPTVARLKEIVHRRSVAKGRKVSEATMVEIAVRKLPMPPKPTAEKLAEYERKEQEKKSKAKGGK